MPLTPRNPKRLLEFAPETTGIRALIKLALPGLAAMACKVLVSEEAAFDAAWVGGYVSTESTLTDPAVAVALQVAPEFPTKFEHHSCWSVLTPSGLLV